MSACFELEAFQSQGAQEPSGKSNDLNLQADTGCVYKRGVREANLGEECNDPQLAVPFTPAGNSLWTFIWEFALEILLHASVYAC